MGSRSAAGGDLELNGYLQGASADSGIDAASFTATQSSTASSTAAFRARDQSHGREDAAGKPDSLAVAVGGGEGVPARSPSAFPLLPDGASYGPSDAASHCRCASMFR